MSIQPASDGWFIEWNGRPFHLNQTWLDEMFKHQVKTGRKSEAAFNQLSYTFQTSTDPDVVYRKFVTFYDSTGNYEAPPAADSTPTPFQQFIRENRASRK